ncbi:juvenile hormone esterase-like [Tribolium castaneum]|uniref:Carboxylic ester hydrolase n=1 Tax=Tribolium castaneum TaxID=7070 RepID=D6WYY2_TRICA|nr:PREDICTED: cholinesterase 1 [Tribolium castaneum]EFA09024.1 Esterase-6-like Protein [Tribolium castaneum]|eukprot:XP_008197517.1 PREDICTED: cholinesterase 1 [Tribolium castaneum]
MLVRFAPISLLFLPGVICLNYISPYTQNTSLQIQLPEGVIQGRARHTNGLGMPYYSYEGIPYAKPPVGELRFKPPQAPDKWNGVLDADGDVPHCVQIPPVDENESEDCLYLNVYVPKPEPENAEPKPVMVWIYGGGFTLGWANWSFYGPDFLLEQDVIVVHFNYRLNVFGFLSTGDLASPGNYGLKDQLAVLKWVKTNIPLFGGDPENITIFGESAGAASVQYHLISPKSRGLFQRAISESGSTICPWALQAHPVEIARKIGLAAGFVGGGTTSELVAHLRGLSTHKLKIAAITGPILTFKMEDGLTFSPVFEPEHDDAFLTKSTLEALKKGDFERVPYIVGFNSREVGIPQKTMEVTKTILNLLPSEILIPRDLNNRAKKAGDEIKAFYFGDKSQTRAEQYLNFYSDNAFYRPIIQSARLYSKHAPLYMYEFSYQGYLLGKKALQVSEDNEVNGVMHSEELWYIFSRRDLKRANQPDQLIRRRMVKLWTNFAKFGNPTPSDDDPVLQNTTWPRYQPEDFSYLNIDLDMRVEKNFRSEAMEFWRKLYDTYARPPFNTY